MLRVLITGGDGQLGTTIARLGQETPNHYVAATIKDVDITNPECIMRVVEGYDVVVNCAAYTNVEEAEEHEAEAMLVNGYGAEVVAQACKHHGARLIHISTDYVFGGDQQRNTPYNEEDKVAPINVYGQTKAAGERAVVDNGGIVLRTSWLYGPVGKNFCLTMLRLAATNKEIRVVSDQRGTPTSTLSLARAILAIIEGGDMDKLHGIYHFTDLGEASWHEFAKEIIAQSGLDCNVVACTSAEYPTKARRPNYSTLSKRRIQEVEGIVLRPWQEALSEVISLIKR